MHKINKKLKHIKEIWLQGRQRDKNKKKIKINKWIKIRWSSRKVWLTMKK